MPPDSRNYRDWLAYSDDDWESALILAEAHRRNARWLFQQAAEKALKAVLVARGQEVPHIHDLPRLLALVQRDLPADSKEVGAAVRLGRGATAARYPADLPELTSSDIADLKEAAETLRSFAAALATAP
ncbi:MAG TPA: HEPN domain-containing protein [Candidatus Thermoplasmatota archaeon]|nr:HEPN domain-containing protein [Candidatus Thermoplasmatota archaeon]